MYRKILICITSIIYLPLPVHAERYSSGGEAFFVGAMQGLFLMLIIWLWSKYKSKKSKGKSESSKESEGLKDIKVNDDVHTKVKSPWEEYKLAKPELSIVIESLSLWDLDKLSIKDINQVESTLTLMTKEFECSTTELKEVCLYNIMKQFTQEELAEVISNLSVLANEESRKLSTAPEYTMPFIIKKWVEQYWGLI